MEKEPSKDLNPHDAMRSPKTFENGVGLGISEEILIVVSRPELRLAPNIVPNIINGRGRAHLQGEQLDVAHLRQSLRRER